MRSLRKILTEIILIVFLSSVLGFGVNISLVRKFFKGEFKENFVSLAEYPGVTYISLAEAEDFFIRQDAEALFIDARPRNVYARGHILGAVNIPFEEVEKGILSGHPALYPDRIIIIYCDGGGCLDSVGLARWLYGRGMTTLRIYSGGFIEWQAAGLPMDVGDGSE